jgi:hypothetical protein
MRGVQKDKYSILLYCARQLGTLQCCPFGFKVTILVGSHQNRLPFTRNLLIDD